MAESAEGVDPTKGENKEGFAMLPQIIIQNIYEYLPFMEIMKVSPVCRSWREVSRAPVNWYHCSCTIKELMLKTFLKFIKTKAKYIKSLEIKHRSSTLEHIKNRSMCIEECARLYASADENMLLAEALLCMDKLECLKLLIHFEITVVPSSLKHLHIAPRQGKSDLDLCALAISRAPLERLMFHCYHHDCYADKGFSTIVFGKHATLKHLSISCSGLRPSTVSLVAHARNLVSLCLWSYFVQIHNDPISFIMVSSGFKYLQLEILNTEEENLISSFAEAKSESIVHLGLYLKMPIISPAFFATLPASFPNLETLCLDTLNLEDGFRNIPDYLMSQPHLKNFLIRNEPGFSNIPSYVLQNLKDIKEKKDMQMCLCYATFLYEIQYDPKERWKHYRETNFLPCKICDLYFSPFVCDCFSML